MASFTGTFSAVNNTSGILILQPQEVVSITLTNTGGHGWSVSLRQIIGGSAEIGLLTFTSDQSATQYTNTSTAAQTLRLRCMTLSGGDTIAYTFADAPSSDVLYRWTDPEGNLLFSITEAGPVVPSNATLTASGPSTLTGAVTTGSTMEVTGTLTADAAVNMVKGADIASAATINLTTATGNWCNVTGTTTITAITLATGLQRLVRFTGILTLTHGASLVLPGAANITTAAGDYALFVGDASSVVRCVYYSPATGTPVGPAAAGTLTGTTLASNVTASSLTSVGTLTTATVSGLTTVASGDTVGLKFSTGTGRWPVVRGFALTGDSSADVKITGVNYGMVHLVNASTGAVALALWGYGDVTSIVAQVNGTAGAEWVTTAPSAGQSRVYAVSGSLYIRSGSSRNGNIYGAAVVSGAIA